MKRVSDEFKNYVLHTILKEWSSYRAALESGDFEIWGTPRCRAAAITPDEDILLNPHYIKMGDEKNDKILSLLIRHEILHHRLAHFLEDELWGAEQLGFTYKQIKDNPELKDDIKKLTRGPSEIGRKYGKAAFTNIGGDLDLARFYLEEDEKIIKEIGGLSRKDFPELDGIVDTKKLYSELFEMEMKLQWRKLRKISSDTIDSPNPLYLSNDFDKNNIRGEDIHEVRIATYEEIQENIKPSEYFICFLEDFIDKNDKNKCCPPIYLFNNGNIELRRYENTSARASVFIEVTLHNADEYQISIGDLLTLKDGNQYKVFSSIRDGRGSVRLIIYPPITANWVNPSQLSDKTMNWKNIPYKDSYVKEIIDKIERRLKENT